MNYRSKGAFCLESIAAYGGSSPRPSSRTEIVVMRQRERMVSRSTREGGLLKFVAAA